MELGAEERSRLAASDELNQQLLDFLDEKLSDAYQFRREFPAVDLGIGGLVKDELIPQFGLERSMTLLAHIIMTNPYYQEHLNADNVAWAKTMRPIHAWQEYRFNSEWFYPSTWDISLDAVINYMREYAYRIRASIPEASDTLSGQDYIWTFLCSDCFSSEENHSYNSFMDALSGIDIRGMESDLLTICIDAESAEALARVLQALKKEIPADHKEMALPEDAGLSDITPEASKQVIVQAEPQKISQIMTALPLVQSLEGSHSQGKRNWVTTEQIADAKAVPMEELARRLGYELKKEGRSFRFERDSSITISNNLWTDHAPSARGTGGSTIDFLTKYHSPGMSFQDAVREIHRLCLNPVDDLLSAHEWLRRTPTETSPAEFALPERSMTARNVTEYLTKTRGIAEEIVIEQLRNGNLYQSAPYDNCCFVGYDGHGTPRSAFQRGTSKNAAKRFLGEVQGSCKEYPFLMKGNSGHWLYVFESAIDALSHATLARQRGENWTDHSRLSLNGVGSVALERYLDEHEGVIGVTLCLDNDEAGLNATKSIRKLLTERYTHLLVETETPREKDVNEDLLATLNRMPEIYDLPVASARGRGI